MSLNEMRTELKKLRKEIMPTPVSRMKKCDITNQIERLKPSVQEVKKIEVVAEKKTKGEPKKIEVAVVVKKTKGEPKKEPADKKEEVVVKKTKGAKKEPADKKQEVKKAKAGSVEMRTKMATLRAKRTTKKSE